MTYSLKNLRDVEDMAPKFGFDEFHEARFPWRDLGAEVTGMGYFVVKPGKRQPFAHRHHEVEELHVILSGSGRVKIDDEVLEVGPLDAIRIGPGSARAFEAGPDGLAYVVFGPHATGESDMIEDDYWDD